MNSQKIEEMRVAIGCDSLRITLEAHEVFQAVAVKSIKGQQYDFVFTFEKNDIPAWIEAAKAGFERASK